jgi:phosphoribosylformimino-5-aminoimidazole carboxamide ribotide isomerase
VQIQPFQIIPVIDLMRGKVVHAKLGHRNEYKPINTMLCESCEAVDIVSSLLELYPFSTLYIADIDAILGIGNNDKLIESIKLNFPHLKIWLDAGIHQSNSKVMPVLGSESIENLQSYHNFNNSHVLSLDYNIQGALGLIDLHESTKNWPDEIICMTLNAVGSSHGADYARLDHLIKLNSFKVPPSKIYAAGGVRNIKDVQILASMNLSGVLLASSLHNKSIKHEDIIKFYEH